MPAPKELDPTASPAARFGAELRKYRYAAKLTQEQLADRIGYSKSRIGNVERGDEKPTRELINLCEKALDLDGVLLTHWPAISGNQVPQWYRQWPAIERRADQIISVAPLIMPGLAQTEEYARAIFAGEPDATPQQIEEAIQARLERQTIFTRPAPPQYLAVMDEGILYRPIGDNSVTRRQLEHLVTMAENNWFSVQLIPYEALCTAALVGPIVLAQEDGVPIAAYVESALHGRVVDKPDEIKRLVGRLECVRKAALPEYLSMQRIKERAASWN
ncbi:helix-turn-helix domain-containing protein [Nonomuraea cavernae]|uniref:Transcriptional regulator n=1 Tax=Nonomuraea cavernae TaxID=2045107 RepID=A0A917ZDP7_9ACTN|nr:helix-turn-helix transcriptional regulator [Nonomuraea cavernae]MCA2190314.1 helix-turn-helix transcriptional regulator [Nonomuraea cavernae]GGO80602.1 transcriptional regulator [Nonomuraea cavernae]